MRNLRAKITTINQLNARQPRNKFLIATYNVVVHTNEGLVAPVALRLYMSGSQNASVIYACIWIRLRKVEAKSQYDYLSGSGQAGGYGYHKGSAAVQAAIESAGIALYGTPYYVEPTAEESKNKTSIAGVGEDAIRSALKAIARMAGYKGKLLLIENGC